MLTKTTNTSWEFTGTYPYWEWKPYPYISGYTCPTCGMWVNYGSPHSCYSFQQPHIAPAVYTYPTLHHCTLCWGTDDVQEFGAKYICRGCTNRLIEEAIREHEFRVSHKEE